jgi:hypothetical protein
MLKVEEESVMEISPEEVRRIIAQSRFDVNGEIGGLVHARRIKESFRDDALYYFARNMPVGIDRVLSAIPCEALREKKMGDFCCHRMKDGLEPAISRSVLFSHSFARP